MMRDPFAIRKQLSVAGRTGWIYSLEALAEQYPSIKRLPCSLKVLLEGVCRNLDGFYVRQEDVEKIATWKPESAGLSEIPFRPARVILQDFTGVPSVVDLAALRSALARRGGRPELINPQVPVDLVIDHSVQVDSYGSPRALAENARLEFERNRERYEFLRWGAKAFRHFRAVPPATGIVHQVNLEYLASVVQETPDRESDGKLWFPDSLVGTDSHTTMINGIGVLGWGVGGIEAEAVMLGEPISMLLPPVVGLRFSHRLPEGTTATDLVLRVTELLREHGVVGSFVEFFGPGLAELSLPDRATISNMAPEYGATVGYFPIDRETLRYLAQTGRDESLIARVEGYARAQGLFVDEQSPDPVFSEVLELDLSSIEASLAGPVRPQDRVTLTQIKPQFQSELQHRFGKNESPAGSGLDHGAVVIAAITSCTNTSNPGVMLAAGLLARKAVQRGLKVPGFVKTSLAPGSRVVTNYLKNTGLLEDLEQLRFHVVGYGCTTCIGNSGPLDEEIVRQIRSRDLVVAGVLSGNRNFEGRINPHVRANYLASPPLVVAYALAGRIDIDFETEPLGEGSDGNSVFLRDIWPSNAEISELMTAAVKPSLFSETYATVFTGNPTWNEVRVPEGLLFEWDPESTYVREPSFFDEVGGEEPTVEPIEDARVLLMLGDSVTTDHISPAGNIAQDSPAARYLVEHGVEQRLWNSYGSRRGNHEVMVRGTFANIRIRNELVPGTEGGYAFHFPSREILSVFDAAERYREEQTPLIVIAGKDYGTGSSRDWAAKGTQLLGVRAVIAESYERIHRSNLVYFGVLPLQFLKGESRKTLGLDGSERYTILGLDELSPGKLLEIYAEGADGRKKTFQTRARLDTPADLHYFKNGGVLHAVLRKMISAE